MQSNHSFETGIIFSCSLGKDISGIAAVFLFMHLTRRAFFALRVIRLQGQMTSRRPQDFLGMVDRKSEDFSKSVCSFGLGPIFFTFLRSRHIQEFIRCVQGCVVGRVLARERLF